MKTKFKKYLFPGLFLFFLVGSLVLTGEDTLAQNYDEAAHHFFIALLGGYCFALSAIYLRKNP